MIGYTDIHSHCIWGVDDGAKTEAVMRHMLDAAYQNGIRTLFATPHVTLGIRPFAWDVFREHAEQAREYCQQQQYDIRFIKGAELLYTPAMDAYMQEHTLPTLGKSEYVLVEFMPSIAERELEWVVRQLNYYGYIPILAHIERYNCMYSWHVAQRIRKRYDVFFQVNANSLLQKPPIWVRFAIRQWIQKETIDFIASDAHNLKERTFKMQEAYTYLRKNYSKDVAEKLTIRSAENLLSNIEMNE